MSTLPLIGRIDNWSGYGQFTASLIEAWQSLYGPVEFHPVERCDKHGLPSEAVLRCMTPRRNHSHPWEMILLPADGIRKSHFQAFKRTVVYTMWESTKLRPEVVEALNAAALVLVPCEWCLYVFAANGVTTPIEVVPLGVDLEFWLENARNPQVTSERQLVFGTAGCWSGGGVRKGARLVMEAFLEAFDEHPVAALKVKGLPGDPLPSRVAFNKIHIDKTYMTRSQLRDWFDTIDCFVSGSGMEGWGFMQQEAMIRGAPLIGAITGGVAEFAAPNSAMDVTWTLAAGEGPYVGLGHYPRLDKAALVDAMRRMLNEFRDRIPFRSRSDAAMQSAAEFGLGRTCDRLRAALLKHNFPI